MLLSVQHRAAQLGDELIALQYQYTASSGFGGTGGMVGGGMAGAFDATVGSQAIVWGVSWRVRAYAAQVSI